MDAHYPYVSKPEFNEWGSKELRDIHEGTESPHSKSITKYGDWWKLRAFESLYDGGIRQADAALEAFVDTLRARGELEDILLVVTSDHGEWSRLNSDVSIVDHSWGIHEVLTHVPSLSDRWAERTVTKKMHSRVSPDFRTSSGRPSRRH